jgi:hypothetical protein
MRAPASVRWARILLRRSSGRVEGHLFISHFHFDHIVGFPFFRPLYGKNNKFTVYGCEGTGRKLENIFVGQMSPEYFPVTMAEMPAELQFVQVTTRPLNLNGWTITPAYINHPGLALAYKIENGKSKVVYMTDNEPFRYLLRQQARKAEIFDDLKSGKVELEREDLLLVDFFEGADVLIHDGQYTQDEYPSRLGMGPQLFRVRRGNGRPRPCEKTDVVSSRPGPHRRGPGQRSGKGPGAWCDPEACRWTSTRPGRASRSPCLEKTRSGHRNP